MVDDNENWRGDSFLIYQIKSHITMLLIIIEFYLLKVWSFHFKLNVYLKKFFNDYEYSKINIRYA